MTEQNTSIRIVQLVHTITGLTIFLYPYFFFFKSLVLMEEVRAYPIFHISFTLFKQVFFSHSFLVSFSLAVLLTLQQINLLVLTIFHKMPLGSRRGQKSVSSPKYPFLVQCQPRFWPQLLVIRSFTWPEDVCFSFCILVVFPKLSAVERGIISLTKERVADKGKAGSIPITAKQLNGSVKHCPLLALC